MKSNTVGILNVCGKITPHPKGFESWGKVGCELRSKTLKEFKPLLKQYPNYIKKNLLTVEYMPWTSNEQNYDTLLINGAEIKVNEENMPKLSVLNKFLKKLSQNTFTLQKDYYNKPIAFESVFSELPQNITEKEKEIVKKAHEPIQYQGAANFISEQINRLVCEHYNTDFETIKAIQEGKIKL